MIIGIFVNIQVTDNHLFMIFISDSVRYFGCDDADLRLFESQHAEPEGMNYYSFVIHGDKVGVMDKMKGLISEKLSPAYIIP